MYKVGYSAPEGFKVTVEINRTVYWGIIRILIVLCGATITFFIGLSLSSYIFEEKFSSK